MMEGTEPQESDDSRLAQYGCQRPSQAHGVNDTKSLSKETDWARIPKNHNDLRQRGSYIAFRNPYSYIPENGGLRPFVVSGSL